MSSSLAYRALVWGAAFPDTTDCWSTDRTFEQCCVAWDLEGSVVPRCKLEGGQSLAAFHDKCCVPSKSWPPRSFFSCTHQDEYWQVLRKVLALKDELTTLIHRAPPYLANLEECIVGGVTARIVEIAIASRYWLQQIKREAASKLEDYESAEQSLDVLLRSPITLEELLASGWEIFTAVSFLRSLEAVQVARQYLPGLHTGMSTTQRGIDLLAAVRELVDSHTTYKTEIMNHSLNLLHGLRESVAASADEFWLEPA
eukprot:186175-Amphidinium_carterae.1